MPADLTISHVSSAVVLSVLLLGVTAAPAQSGDETFAPVADIQILWVANS